MSAHVLAGDFLPFSRGPISAHSQSKISTFCSPIPCLFFPIKKSKKKKKMFFFFFAFFLETTTTYEKQ